MKKQFVRSCAVAGGVLCALLFAFVATNSLMWLGKTFPGFFVMENRVVASISLPDWPDPSKVFQHEVVAVDGIRMRTSREIYNYVESKPPGTAIRYTMQERGKSPRIEIYESQVFTRADFGLLFGTFFVNGIAFVLIGLVVVWLKPEDTASRGLFSACVVVGVFVITAVDLYGPHLFFRIHVMAESLAPAAFIHLALVFPTDRLGRARAAVLTALYAPFVALGIVYELFLMSPVAYSLIHLVASTIFGACGIVIIGSVAYDLLTASATLTRRRIGIVALGTVSGFLLPTLIWAYSGIVGGRVPLNLASLTAFLFPLSIGYAIVQRDLFEIDVMLRRALAYGIVVVVVTSIYFAALLGVGLLAPGRELLARSPASLALLNLLLLFLISPARERAQALIDQLFFRKKFAVEHALSNLSQRLASARTIEAVVDQTTQVLNATICPAHMLVLARGADGRFRPAERAKAQAGGVVLPHEVVARIEQAELVVRYEWEDDRQGPLPAFWNELRADILLPVRFGENSLGLWLLGKKASGRLYNANDVVFLRAAANQIALAMTNATAFGKLEELNATLEHQVDERTAALHDSNDELNESLGKLKQAYEQLERTHASLLRADRLATLGRLTAGLAHEMSTPLGAVLNALKIISDLGEEYEKSIDNERVLPEDHHGIAQDLILNARAATDWASKAASFIRSVKSHGREGGIGNQQRFTVRDVVNDARGLVAHRLRTSSCRIEFSEATEGTSLVGDAGRFGQVLVNLISNAIDAYEERDIKDGPIEITAEQEGDGTMRVRVQDRAGGIPASVLPHIFDELYTTKGAGRGTGLGLWISRNLVEQTFGGTLGVVTTGEGSCFTAAFSSLAQATRLEDELFVLSQADDEAASAAASF